MIDTANILTGALSQALETMAFMEILPMEEDASAPDETLCAEISFNGPQQQGRIQIIVGRAFAETLAENIGALDEVTEADCRDALQELANVTCGLVTPIIASGLSDVYELTIPRIKDNEEVPTWETWTTDPEACVLNVEENTIAAKLTMDN
jgi:hypothetical protein